MNTKQINRREILRYLGYRGAEPDQTVRQMIEQSIDQLNQAVAPKHLCREFPLVLTPENFMVDGGCFAAKSKSLSKNLKDCEKLIVFAATLGTGADYLIQKYNRIEMSRAVIIQAAAAAMIEAYCNQVCQELKQQYERNGWHLRPRFSPGYGDFSLDCQSSLLEALEAGKRIGIKLTGSLLMMPSKSVTAVIGVSQKPSGCDIQGCEVCNKRDCLYRR